LDDRTLVLGDRPPPAPWRSSAGAPPDRRPSPAGAATRWGLGPCWASGGHL